MGGNALNSIRLPKDEYHEYTKEVLEKLGTILRKDSFEPIRAYKNKPSYGDLDIVINNDAVFPKFHQTVIDLFGVTEIHKEGTCFSIKYKEFQIDLIINAGEYYEFSTNYYAWNDCGNLIGKLARRVGFKFGHKGLYYDIMENKNVRIARILVSRNFYEVLKFVDLDFDVHQEGFDELEDMFKFIVGSKYFTPEMYQFEYVNNQSRVRDRKRPTYISFLEYIKGMPENPNHEDKSFHRDRAFGIFPHFKERYDEAIDEYNIDKAFKEKLNGNVVMDIVDVSGKALGEFIAIIKNKYPKLVIIAMSADNVRQLIVKEFDTFKSNI